MPSILSEQYFVVRFRIEQGIEITRIDARVRSFAHDIQAIAVVEGIGLELHGKRIMTETGENPPLRNYGISSDGLVDGSSEQIALARLSPSHRGRRSELLAFQNIGD